MNAHEKELEEIAAMIHSDDSPVGIDAKKTHVYIIHLLRKLDRRIDQIEAHLDGRE